MSNGKTSDNPLFNSNGHIPQMDSSNKHTGKRKREKTLGTESEIFFGKNRLTKERNAMTEQRSNQGKKPREH